VQASYDNAVTSYQLSVLVLRLVYRCLTHYYSFLRAGFVTATAQRAYASAVSVTLDPHGEVPL
jgi:hypothetical protein